MLGTQDLIGEICAQNGKKVVIEQDRKFLSGSQEERNAGMTYETTAGRYKNPFLLSSLPAFLRSSGAMVVEAILFGCCYAAS